MRFRMDDASFATLTGRECAEAVQSGPDCWARESHVDRWIANSAALNGPLDGAGACMHVYAAPPPPCLCANGAVAASVPRLSQSWLCIMSLRQVAHALPCRQDE